MAEQTTMEKLISLCKRRGFIFQSGEQYGGLQGFWDYGPLGVELKNNIKKAWWKKFVQERDDVVGLDSSIITNPTVWEKSGHLGNFFDYLSECKRCHRRYKMDVLKGNKWVTATGEDLDDFICKNCGANSFTEPKTFNTMFKTFVGPTEDTASTAYLRPETAQSIFVNFNTVRQSMRKRIPFGIAQIGKVFRNEITPSNFIFRSREFEQMEMEFFINPKDDDKWFKQWLDARFQWYHDLGIKKEHLHQHEQKKDELAHYAKHAVDIEYDFPFGKKELEGIHNRKAYDLEAHGIMYKDDVNKEEFVPYVIETSAGVDRAALAFLLDAYEEVAGGRTKTTESTKEKEVVLRLHKDLAPYKVAILPLSKKEQLAKPAKEIFNDLRKHWMVSYDDVASIGRRYRRQDEIGTPYCITYDFDSNDDNKVTVRDRDTMEQERIAIDDLRSYLSEKLI